VASEIRPPFSRLLAAGVMERDGGEKASKQKESRMSQLDLHVSRKIS